MCLQLQLPLGDVARPPANRATAAAGVLSVTLLAGGATTAISTTSSAAAAAAAESQSASPAADHTHRAAHVLAKLPLLLLPAAAADELQQLYTALVAEGGSCSTAYQQLLTLLQDLAGVLVYAGAAAASSNSSPSSSADQSSSSSSSNSSASGSSLLTELVKELAAYFASQGMDSCLQLLPEVITPQAANAAAAADEEQSMPPTMLGAAANHPEGMAAEQQQPLLPQVTTPSTAAAAEDEQQQEAAVAGKLASSSSSITGKQDSCAAWHAAASHSSSSRPASSTPTRHGASPADVTDDYLHDASTSVDSKDASCKQQSKSSSSSSTSNSADCGAAPAADNGKSSSSSSSTLGSADCGAASSADLPPQQQGIDARDYPASAFRINARTLLFGFPEAAVEAAYGSYKTCTLRVPCLVLFLLAHAALACVCTVRLARLLLHGSQSTSSSVGGVPDHSMQVHMAVLRLLYPAMYTAAHALVWAAGALQHWQQQPHWLHLVRRHSGVVLSAGMLAPTVALAGSALTGGSWAAACASNNAEFLAVPWVFCVYRHVVEPFQFRAGLLVSFVTLAVQLLLFDPLYTRPQLLGIWANGTALLLCCVHLCVASLLEWSMRRRFVRSVLSSRED
jgi:hypothetical protein